MSSNNLQNDSKDAASVARTGRWMLYVFWIIVLILGSFIGGFWQDLQNNPNQTYTSSINSQGLRSVTLKKNRYGHYVFNGAINQHTVTFMLDTGASDVVIPEKTSKRLNLVEGITTYANTANGVIPVKATRLESLSIGDITLYNIKASINPHMDGDEILLGMSVLQNLDFSQTGDVLTLTQRP